MYQKKKFKTLILDFIPFLLISIIISLILFSLASLSSSFDTTLNYSNYNTALAFPPATQTQTDNNDTTTSSGFTIDTDKIVYVAGEYIVVDGKVDKVMEGKNVRLDFYGPDGKPISMSLFIEPNENGFFSYSGINSVYIPSNAKQGEYTLLATYNKKSVETQIMVK